MLILIHAYLSAILYNCVCLLLLLLLIYTHPISSGLLGGGVVSFFSGILFDAAEEKLIGLLFFDVFDPVVVFAAESFLLLLLFCVIVSPSVGNASARGNSFFGSVFLVEGANDVEVECWDDWRDDVFLLRNDGGIYDCLVLTLEFVDTGIFQGNEKGCGEGVVVGLVVIHILITYSLIQFF